MSYSITTNNKGGTTYNRCFHRDEINVINKIIKCYKLNERQVVLTSSGIEALSLLLETIMISNQFKTINLFYSDELYCDSPRLIKYFSEVFGVLNIIKFNVLESNKLKNTLISKYKNDINIVMMESCSNPNGKIFDFELIKIIKENTLNTKFIVDNTWMTHICFNPFEYNVDFVFCSTSKHYSGGNCIGGFIAGPQHFMNNLANFKVISGKHISLPYCDILNKNIPNMEERVIKAFENTFELSSFMNSQKCFVNVNYPLLEDNKSFNLSKKYFKYGPNMFSFVLPLSKSKSINWMKSFKTISYKTSFGSSETKFDCWPVLINQNQTQCRIAIGYDSNIKNIIEEFKIKIKEIK